MAKYVLRHWANGLAASCCPGTRTSGRSSCPHGSAQRSRGDRFAPSSSQRNRGRTRADPKANRRAHVTNRGTVGRMKAGVGRRAQRTATGNERLAVRSPVTAFLVHSRIETERIHGTAGAPATGHRGLECQGCGGGVLLWICVSPRKIKDVIASMSAASTVHLPSAPSLTRPAVFYYQVHIINSGAPAIDHANCNRQR